MSHKIGTKLKRLCRSLVCMVAMHLRPAASRVLRCEIKSALRACARPADRRGGAALDDRSHALEVFGKAFGSLPMSAESSSTVSAIEAFVCKVREEVMEFCSRKQEERKPVAPRCGRRTKVARSPGLANLTVTLNLARGDLEGSILAF